MILSFFLQGVTKIKFLTDGVLLREMAEDPLLTQYRYLAASTSLHTLPLNQCIGCNLRNAFG